MGVRRSTSLRELYIAAEAGGRRKEAGLCIVALYIPAEAGGRRKEAGLCIAAEAGEKEEGGSLVHRRCVTCTSLRNSRRVIRLRSIKKKFKKTHDYMIKKAR